MNRTKRGKARSRKTPAKRKKTSAALTGRVPNTGSEPIPPGATRKAADREIATEPELFATDRPYHAAGDPDSPDESYEATDSNEPLADEWEEEELDALEQGPPYAGHSGGAVGGSPAETRSSGGRIRGGLKPGGVHRGDSTIGASPESE